MYGRCGSIYVCSGVRSVLVAMRTLSRATTTREVSAVTNISSKIKDLALTLSYKINNTNYKG